jgi:hypothetical protein
MIKITLDAHCVRLKEKHPVLVELSDLEKKKKVKFYTSESELEKLEKIDKKLYEKLTKICFPDKTEDVSLTTLDVENLCMLINHVKSKRDFFLTLNHENFIEKGKREKLGRFKIKVRKPDEKFVSELKNILK